MRRLPLVVISILAILVAAPAFADRVVYSVDGATATPQPVTVTTKADGVVVVLFAVPEIQDGMVLAFTLDLKTRSNGTGLYPATGALKVKGRKVYELPAEMLPVTFDGPDQTVSVPVVLTVHKPGHGKVKKLQAKVKLAMEGTSEVGNGPGVKVIVVETPGEFAPGGEGDADIRALLDELDITLQPPLRKEE